jgi:hypothetical protein
MKPRFHVAVAGAALLVMGAGGAGAQTPRTPGRSPTSPARVPNTAPARVPNTAQRAQVIVPAETVVRLELADRVNSRDALRGDRVVATLGEGDRSGFPIGTRFEGVITEVRKASDDRPAVLGMEFRRAVLPDGASVSLHGNLVSLSEDDVRRDADGRLRTRHSDGKFDWKWVGIGAGGGAVLGQIFGDDFLKGAILGGIGGAIYGYLNRDRDRGERYRDMTLEPGTEFGVRLAQEVGFDARSTYRYSRRGDDERVLGDRDEFRWDTPAVYVDGRPVRFAGTGPLNINGTFYIPLRAVAESAGWDVRHHRGGDEFSLVGPDGTAVGAIDRREVTLGSRSYPLGAAPLLIGGEVYVPVEYLSRVGRMESNWNREQRRLDLSLRGSRPRIEDRDLRRDDLDRRDDRDFDNRDRDRSDRIEPDVPVSRLTPNQLLRGLADLDYDAFRADVRSYRILSAREVLSEEDLRLLGTLIDDNSLARRNRNLVTTLLRNSNRTTANTVVLGVDERQRVIYTR